MTPTKCESFEIMIERESYGAASEAERTELAAHLATCDGCRAYAENAARSRRGLIEIADTAHANVDWGKNETRLRGEIARRLRRTLLLAMTGPIAVAIAIWGADPEEDRIKLTVLLIAVVGTIIGLKIRSVFVSMRRLASLTESGEFFSAYQADVTRRIRALERLRWVALGVVVVLCAAAIAVPDSTIHERIARLALAAIVAGVWLHDLISELPRLRAQRDLLSGAK